jgi:hypothetical protein
MHQHSTLCVVLASTASAQTFSEEIGGGGTPNFIANFTGAHKIGKSGIFQSPSGNIGIGTTNPLFPLIVTAAHPHRAHAAYPPIRVRAGRVPALAVLDLRHQSNGS